MDATTSTSTESIVSGYWNPGIQFTGVFQYHSLQFWIQQKLFPSYKFLFLCDTVKINIVVIVVYYRFLAHAKFVLDVVYYNVQVIILLFKRETTHRQLLLAFSVFQGRKKFHRRSKENRHNFFAREFRDITKKGNNYSVLTILPCK